MKFRTIGFAVLGLMVAATLIWTGCAGGSSTPKTSNTAFVNVSVSDPATCEGPDGPYSHVYVTIRDVKVNSSSTAGANDAGWVDLTPSLSGQPMQVDLLGIADNQCFLAMLGSKTELQPGQYQQIRILLLDNNSGASVSGNKCTGAAANCVQLTADGSIHTLNLASEAQTGIKIPSGQIAGGAFVINAGETRDLNIDFNTCASIVITGNGQYRLKPVLHAGEVSTTASSINGTVVDSVSKAAIPGTVVVALEQKDDGGVDRVIMQTTADPTTGQFVFCPVPEGTYDMVIAAVTATGGAYAPLIITGVQPGSTTGTLSMVAPPSSTEASIAGLITTSTGSAATAADISTSALEPVSLGGTSVPVTMPLATQSATNLSLSTATGTSCPANTDCVNYTLSVPADPPYVAAWSSGTISPVQGSGPINYTVDSLAFVPQSGGTADCSPSEVQVTTQKTGGAPLTVTPGLSLTAADTVFTGCQ